MNDAFNWTQGMLITRPHFYKRARFFHSLCGVVDKHFGHWSVAKTIIKHTGPHKTQIIAYFDVHSSRALWDYSRDDA